MNDELTETQDRRWEMSRWMSNREIAEHERVNISQVAKSIKAARQKLGIDSKQDGCVRHINSLVKRGLY